MNLLKIILVSLMITPCLASAAKSKRKLASAETGCGVVSSIQVENNKSAKVVIAADEGSAIFLSTSVKELKSGLMLKAYLHNKRICINEGSYTLR